MDKRIIQALIIAIALAIPAFASRTVYAQAPLEPTQILVGAPAAPDPGGLVTVQAVLADSKGHPISKALIYFTTQAKFLSSTGNVVLAQAVTDSKGQAVAHFTDDFSGPLALQAEFRGDTQYAPSNATAQMGAATSQQVYVEHVGVDLPGFNVAPVGAPMASVQSPLGSIAGFIQSLWPAMNGWPVAAVLLLVWSTYFFAVTFVFRVASAKDEPEESSALDSRRLQ